MEGYCTNSPITRFEMSFDTIGTWLTATIVGGVFVGHSLPPSGSHFGNWRRSLRH